MASFGGRGAGSGSGSVYFGPPKVTSNPAVPTRTASASEGPRLDNLAVDSSAYGEPRPILYGTIRVGGQVIWSDGIREFETITTTTTSSSVNTDTQYSYYASFAFAFAEGIVDDVLRIWADGNLIYDKTVTNNTSGNVSIPGLNFEFYSGSETQGIDPTMLATDARRGLETPAYRGTAYILFSSFPLGDYNNSLPEIEVEVVIAPPALWHEVLGTTFVGSSAVFDAEWSCVDWTRGFVYYANKGTVDTIIAKVDLRTGLNVLERDLIGLIDSDVGLDSLASEMICTPQGDVIVWEAGTGNITKMYVLDGNTLGVKATFGETTGSGGFSKVGWRWPNHLTIASCFDTTNQYDFLIALDTNFDKIGVLALDNGYEPRFVYSNDVHNTDFPTEAKIHSVVHGKLSPEKAVAYIIAGNEYSGASTDSLILYKMTIDKSALTTTDPVAPFNESSSGVTIESIASFPPGQFKSGETQLSGFGGLVYDQANDALIICAFPDSDGGLPAFLSYDMNTFSYSGFWPVYGSIVWSVSGLSQPPGVHLWHQSQLLGNSFGYMSADGKGVKINTKTGAVILDDATANWPTIGDGMIAYDSLTDSFLGLSNPSGGEGPMLRQFYSRSDAAQQDLHTIVQDITTRANMPLADINTNDLNTIGVHGYAISSQSTARAAIDVLSNVYLFDPYESDWVLNFKLQGQTSIKTIEENDLAIQDKRTGDKFIETRQQEVELPERFTINFLDKTNNYIKTAQSVKRVSLPEAAMSSSNQHEISPPIVMTPTLAKQQAEKLLYTSWIERSIYRYRFAWDQLDLDPSDVVVVNFNDGRVIQNRLTSLDMGDGYTIDAYGIREQSGQFNSTVVADGGQGIISQTISYFTAARTFVLDSPLLFDFDDNSRLSGLTYILSGGYVEDEFTSTRSYFSNDNTNYQNLGKQAIGASHGTVVNVMPDPPGNNPHTLDTESTLTVQMSVGADLLETVTQVEIMNGANRAMLVRFDGQVEVINFQNVTANADGTYTLDTFLRGRRGTDTMCTDYTGSESFVLLIDTLSIGKHGLGLGELDNEVFYKVVAAQQLIQSASVMPLTSNLRTLMPYAPVNLVAIEDGSNNIDLTWNRRSRIGGDLVNGTGFIDLQEDTEEYELDILDGPGTKATETLTSTAFIDWNGEIVIIDGKTYTFQNTLTNVDGNVLIGATEELSLQNLIWAINKETRNGKDAHYALATTIHPTVTASDGAGKTMDITAKKYGTIPNLIGVSTNITGASWGATKMSGGADGVLVRAIAGLTTPDYEYSNANIVTDFGSVPATISINLYQISAQVGRGFTGKETIDVQ